MRYVVKWEDGINDVNSEHEDEAEALRNAREQSQKFNTAVVAGIDESGAIVKKWAFEKGKPIPVDGEEPDGNDQPSSQEEESDSAAKAAKKKKGKVAKPKKEATSKKESKSESEIVDNATSTTTEESEMNPKIEKFLEQLEVRPDTKKGKLTKYLLANINKKVTAAQIGKATYGSAWNEKARGSLNMAISGLEATIKEKKVKLELERDKSGKEMTFGLRAK
jgi:hypothetical protein